MFLFIVIIVPVAFVMIMDAVEMLFDAPPGWQRRTMKLGWDTCVLSLGLVGGLFADPEILNILNQRGSHQAMGLLLASVIVSLAMAVLIAFVRQGRPNNGWLALLSLFLGGVTLMLPMYLALLRR